MHPVPSIFPSAATNLAAKPVSGAHLPETGPALNATIDRDIVLYSPIWVAAKVTVGTVGVYANSGNTCPFSVGIYSSEDFAPADLIDDVIPSDTLPAAAGFRQATGLTLTLKRGLYWRALTATGGSGVPQYRALGGFNRWVRPSSSNDLGAAGYFQNGTTLPTTAAPTGTKFQVPRIYMIAA